MAIHGSASTRCPYNDECERSQAMFLPMGATPAPLPAHPLSDNTASIKLDDHTVDCQACRDHPEISDCPMRCLEMPDTKYSPPPHTPATVDEATGVNEEPTSNPACSYNPASLQPSTKETSLPCKMSHRWLGSLLGLGSLILAIVCLLMFTVRSYRMAVWTTRNDELQACIGLIQAGRPVGPNCKRLISEGPQDPPYNLSRRMTDFEAPGGSFTDIGVIATNSFLAVDMKHSAWLISASIFALISLAGLLLSLLRHRCRTDYDFESLAAFEIATLPHSGSRSKPMDDDHSGASFIAARTNPSVGIRRRIARPVSLRQEARDNIGVGDQSVYGEGVSYSIARFLNQPGREGTIGELQYFS